MRAHPTSAGRAVPTVQLEIRGPDGAPVPEGVDGEIHVRSPYLMLVVLLAILAPLVMQMPSVASTCGPPQIAQGA